VPGQPGITLEELELPIKVSTEAMVTEQELVLPTPTGPVVEVVDLRQ
jgi:hypothetical protein